MTERRDENRQGRVIALIIAGTGLFWIAATALGAALDWSQRTRALFDLISLAGFGWGLIMTFSLWRQRQKNKD